MNVATHYDKSAGTVLADTDQSESSQSGWRRLGGASVHIGDDGRIDAGCPGLVGNDPDDLNETRPQRDAAQERAEDAGWESAEQKRARAVWQEAKANPHGQNSVVLAKVGDSLYSFGPDAAALAQHGTGDGEVANFKEDALDHHLERLTGAGHRVAIVSRDEEGGAKTEDVEHHAPEADGLQSLKARLAEVQADPEAWRQKMKAQGFLASPEDEIRNLKQQIAWGQAENADSEAAPPLVAAAGALPGQETPESQGISSAPQDFPAIPDGAATGQATPRFQPDRPLDAAAEALRTAPGPTGDLMRRMNQWRETRSRGHATGQLHGLYAERLYDHLRKLGPDGDGFGFTWDLGQEVRDGAIGYSSPAGGLIVIPPQFQGDDWEARFVTADKISSKWGEREERAQQAATAPQPAPAGDSKPQRDPRKVFAVTVKQSGLAKLPVWSISGPELGDASETAHNVAVGLKGSPYQNENLRAAATLALGRDVAALPGGWGILLSKEEAEGLGLHDIDGEALGASWTKKRPRQKTSADTSFDFAPEQQRPKIPGQLRDRIEAIAGPDEHEQAGFYELMKDVHGQKLDAANSYNGELKRFYDQFAKQDGGNRLLRQLKVMAMRGEDATRIKGFDQVLDFAERYTPSLLRSSVSPDLDPESALIDNLLRGRMKSPGIGSDEVFNEALQMMSAADSGWQDSESLDEEPIPFSKGGWKQRYSRWLRGSLERYRKFKDAPGQSMLFGDSEPASAPTAPSTPKNPKTPPRKKKRKVDPRQGELRWITIGGHEEGDKKHVDGQPVMIDGAGVIQAGPVALEGKSLDNLSKTSTPGKKNSTPSEYQPEGVSPPTTPPEANHDGTDQSGDPDQLESPGGRSGQRGLFDGEQLGADGGPPPTEALSESGDGVGGGVPELPDRPHLAGDDDGGEVGGAGDESALGAGTGDGGTPADAAGGAGTAGAVGDGGGAGDGDASGVSAAYDASLAEPPTPENPTDLAAGNWRYPDRDFFATGLKAKFHANIAAIETLRTIQAEGRDTATPEEQAILSKYVGWGQFPALFNTYGSDWAKEREKLRSLLSAEEYDAARRSTLNAHYTHPDIVDAHWQMAQRLGFDGGRYLETSAGIGYYLGLMPEELASKTHASAVELDPTTGAMLKLLYPSTHVQVQGFQEHQAPNGFYDLIASNVPFGDYKVFDPEYNKFGANIHDYFFLKSLDKVRPGGLVMHITSAGTMDKADSSIREELAKKADLVAAIRFPGDSHKQNAGTSVVTDMLILRKRLPGEEPGGVGWMNVTTVPDPGGGAAIPVNQYFAEHPEQILGTLDRTGSMYSGESMNVSRTNDYEERLQAAIDRLPEGIMRKAPPASTQAPSAIVAPGDVKEGGFKVHNGKVYVREGGGLVEQKLEGKDAAAKLQRLQGHLEIRDAVREVLNAQLEGRDATEARKKLNDVYDAYTKNHGALNDAANKRVFRSDPDAPVLLALEKYDQKTKKAQKADIFHKDTVSYVKTPDKAGTVGEALGISLHEHGAVNIDRMAALTGQHPDRIKKALVDQGIAFEDPSEGWKPADQYLSGNVRRKLALARAAAAVDPKFAAYVAALEKVQPEDVDHTDIEVKLGAGWVPPADVAAFAAHLLSGRPEHFSVNYIPSSGEWHADYSRHGQHLARSRTAREVWGTDHVGFDDLFESALNNTPVTVREKDSQGNSYVNKQATDDANAKIQEIKEAFKSWIWEDDERRERLHRHYNDNFNNIRAIQYDGSHQQFPGKNPAIELRPHQKNFVWQVVTTGKGLAAHEVGTGKTFSMITSAMELRRLGLARKPAIACLKANIEAITNDALKLYPGAKILSTADMFDAKSRRKTISQIATGDYDMVILTHDHLDLLQMKPDTVASYIREEIAELEAAKLAAQEDNPKKDNRVVKKLEKAKARLEEKLQEALDPTKKDNAVYFEETGIDQIFVDEAHKYKSLPVYTKQHGLKGVPTGRSDRATAMQMRTRWLMERNGGRGVVFATGTPVANTMAELYTMQKYLQPQELKDRGIHAFDAWANTFGDVQTKMEFTVSGDYKPVSRFAKFVNVPELMQTVRQVMDVQRADHMTKDDGSPVLVRPRRKDNVVVAPKSPAMEGLMKELQQRAKDLSKKGGPAEKGSDNMLVICTDGRKGALDMRLVDPNAEDDPASKTNMAVDNVLDIYRKNPGKTQLIFSDVGVNPAPHGFHLYGDIIQKLVDGGIPREKIADFSKLEGAKKEAAMEAMRRGEILVGIGSTEKLGTGVNVQQKLTALHHLDVPWLPAAVEQRDGRGWRQGNENKDINIHRYVSEGSLDQTFWQIIGNKTNFIKQVMTPGQSTARVAKDEDTEELSPEQLMAAASGDPRILEKVNLDEEVKNLKSAHGRHERDQAKFRDNVKKGERNVQTLQQQGEALKKHAAALEARPDFHFEVDGEEHTDRTPAIEAFKAKLESMKPWDTHVGKYRGFDVVRDNGKVYLEADDGTRYETGPSLASVEYVARRLPKDAALVDEHIEGARKDLERVRKQIGKEFPKAADLEAKLKRQKELEAELSAKKDEDKDAWKGNIEEARTKAINFGVASKVKDWNNLDEVVKAVDGHLAQEPETAKAKYSKRLSTDELTVLAWRRYQQLRRAA